MVRQAHHERNEDIRCLQYRRRAQWVGPLHRIPVDTNTQPRIVTYQDKSFSLADATSFVVMERLRSRWAFSFDEHFTQYGFKRLSP